jgi:hypothetical protein
MGRYKLNEAPIKVTFQLKPGLLKTKVEKTILCIISFAYYEYNKELFIKNKKAELLNTKVRGRESIIQKIYEAANRGEMPKFYKRLSLSTGITIPEQFWNKMEKKAIGNYTYLNDRLSILEENIEMLYSSLIKLESFELTPKTLLGEIKKHIFKNNEPTQPLPDFTITNPIRSSKQRRRALDDDQL